MAGDIDLTSTERMTLYTPNYSFPEEWQSSEVRYWLQNELERIGQGFDLTDERLLALAGGGGSVNWGDIGGTLSDQTDLQNALNAKLDLAGGTMTGNLGMSGNRILGIAATPTLPTEVPSKSYVDSVAGGGAGWKQKIASGSFTNAVGNGTQRGIIATNYITGRWTFTITTALTSTANAQVMVTPIDGIVAHGSVGFLVNSTTSISVSLRNSTTGSFIDGSIDVDVYDRGLT